MNIAEQIGKEADNYGTNMRTGGITFTHGPAGMKVLEIDRIFTACSKASWTEAMKQLRNQLSNVVKDIDGMLEKQ